MECRETMAMGANSLGIRLDTAGIDRLCLYFTELLKWNSTMNLVARAPDRQIIETHFLDSLTLLPLLDGFPAPPALLDVGSGAGFPGLVVKTVRPHLAVTLVEPRAKRVSFLKHVIRTLGLSGISVLAARLEKGTPFLGGASRQFQVITSRAFTDIARFLELAAPFSPAGGKVICMKGPKAEEEIETWELQSRGSYTLSGITDCTLPFSKATRKLVVFTRRDSEP